MSEALPLFGNALWLEYQDLMGRPVWDNFTTAVERSQVLAALAKQGRWVSIYYGWRPNLPDEADNHLIELALAGGAAAIITHNIRDVHRGELKLGELRVLTPAQCLEEWRCRGQCIGASLRDLLIRTISSGSQPSGWTNATSDNGFAHGAGSYGGH